MSIDNIDDIFYVGPREESSKPCDNVKECPSFAYGPVCAHPTCPKGTDKRSITIGGKVFRRVKEDGAWIWRQVPE